MRCGWSDWEEQVWRHRKQFRREVRRPKVVNSDPVGLLESQIPAHRDPPILVHYVVPDGAGNRHRGPRSNLLDPITILEHPVNIASLVTTHKGD